MTLQQLHYIITVSETGSLSKAAEMLYIAQPSLTSAIKEVEKEAGILIFNRGGRGVTLTNDGVEFLTYARAVCGQYDTLLEKYGKTGNLKKKFGVSAQHYSFAVNAFVEMVKAFDPNLYEFAIRETKTIDVINDVSTLRSEIGILYLSDFNRKFLQKILNTNNLEFHKLIDCGAYAYLSSNHPLAGKHLLHLSDLSPYPCLSFEQGENSSLYFSEELFSANDYSQIIKACDRATMLNLMVGLNGYTLCSGIICEELNGDGYVAVPLQPEEDFSTHMEIGYITKKNTHLSQMGELYISEIERYLSFEKQ